MSVTPRQLGIDERSGPNEPTEIVIIYVCPTCDNYYGSSSMGQLEEKEVRSPLESSEPGTLRGHRHNCPNCHIPRIKRYARLAPIDEVQEIEKQIKPARKPPTPAAKLREQLRAHGIEPEA